MPRWLGQAMIQRDRIELIVVAVIGAVLGGITGVALAHDWLATLIWALIGAVAGLFTSNSTNIGVAEIQRRRVLVASELPLAPQCCIQE
jgi:uncharacterized protein YcfJ